MKNTFNASAASRILSAAGMDMEELSKQFQLNAKGLDDHAVEVSRKQYGSNEIAKKKKENVIKRRSFQDKC